MWLLTIVSHLSHSSAVVWLQGPCSPGLLSFPHRPCLGPLFWPSNPPLLGLSFLSIFCDVGGGILMINPLFWLLRISWTARSNQSILKETNPEYSLEGLMLKLNCPSFGHLMQRTDSLAKTLMLGKIEGRRRGGWQRMRWLHGITDSVNMSLSKLGR